MYSPPQTHDTVGTLTLNIRTFCQIFNGIAHTVPRIECLLCRAAIQAARPTIPTMEPGTGTPRYAAVVSEAIAIETRRRKPFIVPYSFLCFRRCTAEYLC